MRYEPFTIVAKGRSWSGTWHLDKDQLHVSSAYGSAKAALGRQAPKAVAEKLLQGLVTRRA